MMSIRMNTGYFPAGVVALILLGWAGIPSAITMPEPQSSVQQLPAPDSRRIFLDVMVDDKAGKPVSGLEAKDFTLLDNGHAEGLKSFLAFSSPASGGVAAAAASKAIAEPPTRVLILFDTVNASVTEVAKEREEVGVFLRQ